jgi:hypothetical protein
MHGLHRLMSAERLLDLGMALRRMRRMRRFHTSPSHSQLSPRELFVPEVSVGRNLSDKLVAATSLRLCLSLRNPSP